MRGVAFVAVRRSSTCPLHLIQYQFSCLFQLLFNHLNSDYYYKMRKRIMMMMLMMKVEEREDKSKHLIIIRQ